MIANGRTRILLAIGIVAAIVMSALWSWNALAELYGAPQAQLKHLLAAAFLILAVRAVVKPPRARRHHRGHLHEH